jgi:hypothetical protein
MKNVAMVTLRWEKAEAGISNENCHSVGGEPFMKNSKTIVILVLCIAFSLCLCGAGLSYASGVTEEQIQAFYDEQFGALEQEKGRFHTWPIEEKHEWQQANWEIIQTRETDLYGLPGEGDIPEEEARRIALAAIQEKYGTPDVSPFDSGAASSEQGIEAVWFLVTDPENPVWRFQFFDWEIGTSVGTYLVEIDSKTGDLLTVDAGENGFG